MTDRMNESLFLDPVSESEIKERIISLKETATGHDEINTISLKLSNNLIAQPLAHICSLSLTEGVFPHQLKIPNVIPIYNSDHPMLFNHYMPVFLLYILSRVFEKIMYDRLLNFLERYKILYCKQYGFRKKYSTYMALITLMDKLTNAIENGEYVIGIFLDFSKAFDTVNRDILLEKLEHYGIRGCALSWFRSYISNRPQYVTYNGTTSMSQTIKCGVPQRSILGPLLFIIYINDLGNVCVNTMPLLFADGTNRFASGTNIIQLQDAVTNDLSSIAVWLKVNRLSLNIKKTHFMIFFQKETASTHWRGWQDQVSWNNYW